MNSTESGINRWLEHYGEINRDNLCEFSGYTKNSWYAKTGPRQKLKANYYYRRVFRNESLKEDVEELKIKYKEVV